MAKIAPTLWHLWIYDKHALYLFENGVRLDLDFCRPSDIAQPTEVYTDTVIEYDPAVALNTSLPKWNTPLPEEHPKWFEPGDPGCASRMATTYLHFQADEIIECTALLSSSSLHSLATPSKSWNALVWSV